MSSLSSSSKVVHSSMETAPLKVKNDEAFLMVSLDTRHFHSGRSALSSDMYDAIILRKCPLVRESEFFAVVKLILKIRSNFNFVVFVSKISDL